MKLEKIIEIRPYRASHRSSILDLSMRAWEPVFDDLKPAVSSYVYEAFYPQGWAKRQSGDIEALLAAEGDRVSVAVAGDKVLGWIGVRFHPTDQMGEIYILAVDPEHQGKGIGTALIEYALGQMRAAGMSIAMVETGDDPGHKSSRATYERAGFERWPVARYFRKL